MLYPGSVVPLAMFSFKTHDIIVFCMWQRVGNRKDIYPVWKEMFFFSNNFEIEILRHFNFQSDGALNSLRSEIIVKRRFKIFNRVLRIYLNFINLLDISWWQQGQTGYICIKDYLPQSVKNEHLECDLKFQLIVEILNHIPEES